jgi:hypothetical protein
VIGIGMRPRQPNPTDPRSVAGPNPKVCARCGARYADKDWTLLRFAEQIDAGELRRLVRDWPETLCVEVRYCTTCGHTIAAKREARVPAAL